MEGQIKMKKMLMFVMALLLTLAVFPASAQEVCVDCCSGGECDLVPANSQELDIETCDIWVNGMEVYADIQDNEVFERSEDLEVKVRFTSNMDAEDVQVMAVLMGYHRSHKTGQVVDMTPTFDIEANDRVHKTLTLVIPDDFELDTGDLLKLRIYISDKFSRTYVKEINMRVEAMRDYVVVQDVVMDPGTVEAGRGVFVSVRVKNMGDNTEEGIKIVTAIPELGLKATEYIDELEEDESTTSEDMFLRIPSCTEPGEYDVKVTVTYADGDEYTTETATLEVTEDEACVLSGNDKGSDSTEVRIPGQIDVTVGQSGSYPVVIENSGATDRSYELSVQGLDSWATYRFEPGSFMVVRAGETKTVYLYVNAKEDAVPGEKIFMVTVKTSNDVKQAAVMAVVKEGESKGSDLPWTDAKDALQIGVIVLIVLLIVLGLVVAFNKLKGNGKDDEDMSGQTYY